MNSKVFDCDDECTFEMLVSESALHNMGGVYERGQTCKGLNEITIFLKLYILLFLQDFLLTEKNKYFKIIFHDINSCI